MNRTGGSRPVGLTTKSLVCPREFSSLVDLCGFGSATLIGSRLSVGAILYIAKNRLVGELRRRESIPGACLAFLVPPVRLIARVI